MQTDHFIDIYRRKARAYERMIDAEDVDGNLLATLSRLVDFSGGRVIDLGSGTGRLPQLLPHQASGIALDLHRDMLLENRRQQLQQGLSWPLLQGDLHNLPLRDNCGAVIIAGWAIGHFCGWYGDRWRWHVEQALREMLRVARPGADILILETLGTGTLQAAPPNAQLAAYYRLLEETWEFKRYETSTDFQFSSVEEAVQTMRFFFGDALVKEIRRHGWSRVPEWTGVWHRRLTWLRFGTKKGCAGRAHP